MQVVPLIPVPSQTLTVVLSSQECAIRVYQRSTGLYLDLSIGGVPKINGVACLDRNLIVLDAYLGFSGDLAFVDTLGFSDPDYSGVGVRFLLVYLLPSETLPLTTIVPFWMPPTSSGAPTPPPTVPIAPGSPMGVTIT